LSCNVSIVEKSAKLKKWTSREVNNLIFVWFHVENEEPWELPVVKEIEKCDWSFHGKNEFFVNSHIQDIPENGADVGINSNVLFR
jgi:cholesterol 7-desaturase